MGMRCLVFSDIHGRAESLGVLPDDGGLVKFCLGDVCAGDPEGAGRAIDWLREHGALCVSGTHDRPVVDDGALEWFSVMEERLRREGRGNPGLLRRFQEDALRLRRELNEEQLEYISSMPETRTVTCGGRVIQMIHDSPLAREDLTKSRILNVEIARANFGHPSFVGDILLVGHSHVPLVYREWEGEVTETVFDGPGRVELLEGRYILNPGSLQRLRSYPGYNESTRVFEGDDRVTYGILDLDEGYFEVRFVERV